ncbi:DUF2510 domain-containing protein [Microbacterium sp. 4R-513]|uniref:DUF2510 domain-containing protein n=1 Tax=Microbacterium sp. 4R-513 TaxID=2567934 RepID=UPI0013E1173E|nr:DUF2510 domain-containing protein [Microbacterium sp. 4R-513]QIG38140.1 DUF2510 domain-containing protein [Microbacterium sp. 4R-513]
MTDDPDQAAQRPRPHRTAAPAGWFPDPADPDEQLRFWNGRSWTELRRPAAEPVQAPPPSAPAATGRRSPSMTLAGALLIVGGIAASFGEWTSPLSFELAIATLFAFVVYYACLAATFFVFAYAGFPHHGPGMAVVLYGLSLTFLVMLALIVMLGLTGESSWQAVLLITSLVGSALTIAFVVATWRNPLLPRGFRLVVLAFAILTVVANVLSSTAGIGVSGVTAIVVGACFVVLARDSREALEAAAASTDEDRRRLRAARQARRESPAG